MKRTFLAIFVILLVIASVLYIDIKQQEDVLHPIASVGTTTTQQFNVLVIDADRNNVIRDSSIEAGHDIVLLVLRRIDENRLQYDIIESLKELLSYDTNGDSRIDRRDAIFSDLGLLDINPATGTKNIISLDESSVRLIQLHRDRIELAIRNPVQMRGQVIGQVMMGDGSTFDIKLSPVSRGVLYQ